MVQLEMPPVVSNHFRRRSRDGWGRLDLCGNVFCVVRNVLFFLHGSKNRAGRRGTLDFSGMRNLDLFGNTVNAVNSLHLLAELLNNETDNIIPISPTGGLWLCGRFLCQER